MIVATRSRCCRLCGQAEGVVPFAKDTRVCGPCRAARERERRLQAVAPPRPTFQPVTVMVRPDLSPVQAVLAALGPAPAWEQDRPGARRYRLVLAATCRRYGLVEQAQEWTAVAAQEG